MKLIKTLLTLIISVNFATHTIALSRMTVNNHFTCVLDVKFYEKNSQISSCSGSSIVPAYTVQIGLNQSATYSTSKGKVLSHVMITSAGNLIAKWSCSTGSWTNFAEFNENLPCTGNNGIVGLWVSANEPSSADVYPNTIVGGRAGFPNLTGSASAPLRSIINRGADHNVSAIRGGTPPDNDACAGAVNHDLAVGSMVLFTGDNTNATDNDNLGMPATWEMFTTTECANLTITYCGTAPAFGNGFSNIYMGCPFTDFIAAADFDDTTCADGNFTIFYSEVPAGTYYYPVMLDAANNAIGPYTISVTAEACAPPPANDDCAQAANLVPAADCNPVAGTTEGANESMPSIACHGATSLVARDVWYSFTATDVAHTVTVEGMNDFDAVLEAFSGSCAELVSMGCEDSTFPSDGPATE
ncbi:MAG: hypothetical protein JSS84_08945, partial [Bacteroidetes bacterium]|nr:hypothetical protein [Bacteroidota bacterium]